MNATYTGLRTNSSMSEDTEQTNEAQHPVKRWKHHAGQDNESTTASCHMRVFLGDQVWVTRPSDLCDEVARAPTESLTDQSLADITRRSGNMDEGDLLVNEAYN